METIEQYGVVGEVIKWNDDCTVDVFIPETGQYDTWTISSEDY